MIRAIIFDMDGVLVDSEPFHLEIEKRQFELNNLLISAEEHHRYMGVASDVMWREIARGLPRAVLVVWAVPSRAKFGTEKTFCP
jgi:beta-phosphoglucomutase-like phosphatase (HAD superfamily)